jgi:hypothetical protein
LPCDLRVGDARESARKRPVLAQRLAGLRVVESDTPHCFQLDSKFNLLLPRPDYYRPPYLQLAPLKGLNLTLPVTSDFLRDTEGSMTSPNTAPRSQSDASPSQDEPQMQQRSSERMPRYGKALHFLPDEGDGDSELELLGSHPSEESRGIDESGAGDHTLLTAPIFTGDAVQALSKEITPQLAVYGRIISQHVPGFPDRTVSPKLYINSNTPFSALVCGVQVRLLYSSLH